MLQRLNLGCGDKLLDGFINVDIRPFAGGNAGSGGSVQADVSALPFKDNSIDEIVAIDIYEHISFTESKALLKHWVDKLKTGGQIHIQAPSLLRIFQYFWQDPENIDTIEKTIECIFGKQDYLENTHYTICHPVLMEEYLRQAGISGDIEHRFSNTNLEFRAIK